MPSTHRVHAILDMVAHEHKHAKPHLTLDNALSDVYVDFSQNPVMEAYTRPSTGLTGALATSTTLYSYGQDKVFLPPEYMYCQGWKDIVIPDDMSGDELRHLAGEGMALPCLATMLWSVYLVKGFPYDPES